MMYRFKSKATGDLIMMQAVGDQVLRIIGKDSSAQGIVEAAALPGAIDAIERAVTAAEAEPHEDAEASSADGDAPLHDKVSLRQRTWPFVEMMKRAQAEGADIVWGV